MNGVPAIHRLLFFGKGSRVSLKARITEDMKTAMRAKDSQRLGAVRLLLAAIKQREVDERIVLGDADIVAVIEKMLKQRRESVSQYEKAARQDLVDVERFEISILQTYMPTALSEQEVAAEVAGALSATGAVGMADMGRVMAELKTRIGGRADMARVSALVRTKLGS